MDQGGFKGAFAENFDIHCNSNDFSDVIIVACLEYPATCQPTVQAIVVCRKSIDGRCAGGWPLIGCNRGRAIATEPTFVVFAGTTYLARLNRITNPSPENKVCLSRPSRQSCTTMMVQTRPHGRYPRTNSPSTSRSTTPPKALKNRSPVPDTSIKNLPSPEKNARKSAELRAQLHVGRASQKGTRGQIEADLRSSADAKSCQDTMG